MNKLQTGAIVLAAACMAEAAPPGDRGTLDPPAADVHCHFVTPGYLALLEKHGAQMDELYPIPAWSSEALGAFLDEAGIGLAGLTSVAPQPHFGDAAESAAVCREMNDEAARLAAADQELAPHAEAILGGNARRLFAPREQNDDTRQATRDRIGQATDDARQAPRVSQDACRVSNI